MFDNMNRRYDRMIESAQEMKADLDESLVLTNKINKELDSINSSLDEMNKKLRNAISEP
jgi:hypothetical protein